MPSPERQILLHLPIGRSDDRHVRPLHYRPAPRLATELRCPRCRCFQRLDGDPVPRPADQRVEAGAVQRLRDQAPPIGCRLARKIVELAGSVA